MTVSKEALNKYWAENPDALEQYWKDNPDQLALAVGREAVFRSKVEQKIKDNPHLLERYWEENPSELQRAVMLNPQAFAVGDNSIDDSPDILGILEQALAAVGSDVSGGSLGAVDAGVPVVNVTAPVQGGGADKKEGLNFIPFAVVAVGAFFLVGKK